ncbi:TetR/AcrR family transcriptional regulator [Algihabitans albus]|uniref:TetR/AcrR family transcriptional regulator n=1 Tax=Algihabitans albus TaxID=2164067 RepID=UPI001ABCD11A|nr:TetR/AcrR family transcriptional regulator C-terminal domain-containing protein [Algihabitans albus]
MTSAVALLEREGEEGFSIRKVSAKVGCDPMAVLYHFKSKAGLERAMADALNAELKPVETTAPWRERLSALAHQYRSLALRYPRTFPLLLRFWVTGPADYRHAEMIYQALADAGFDDRQTVDICFGWYASILGLAAAEVGGMLQPASAENLAEVRALPPADFPTTTRLVEAFADQEPGRIYGLMIETFLDGVEQSLKAG